MFAGPNGSGKSTVKTDIPASFLGTYLNPDEIERLVRQDGFYDLAGVSLSVEEQEIVSFFDAHPLTRKAGQQQSSVIGVDEAAGRIYFVAERFNSYTSAILTDFLRQKLIQTGHSFTFETVMSSADKLQTLQKAQQEGFRTYLYYVATEDPLINVARIQHRVRTGGHPVPTDKVIERYHRSLNLLLDAIRLTNRAYIFDNSGSSRVWVAEVTEGTSIQLQTDSTPGWFVKAVLDKLS